MDKEFLKGVVGVVEATSFEYHQLWKEWDDKDSWFTNLSGFGQVIGHLDSRPVFLSLRTAIIEGQKVLFIEPTSEVVDWKLIDTWLLVNLPETAMIDKRINRTDAMNFINILR